ncbi:MAG: hypothetical protein R3302_00370 [Sulfurimonadaceae bacterium]|nr:hypothetical protein [Sulfurimonadaceae bacterium]
MADDQEKTEICFILNANQNEVPVGYAKGAMPAKAAALAAVWVLLPISHFPFTIHLRPEVARG